MIVFMGSRYLQEFSFRNVEIGHIHLFYITIIIVYPKGTPESSSRVSISHLAQLVWAQFWLCRFDQRILTTIFVSIRTDG